MNWQEKIIKAVDQFDAGDSSDLNKICKFMIDGIGAIKQARLKGFKFTGIIENIESIGK